MYFIILIIIYSFSAHLYIFQIKLKSAQIFLNKAILELFHCIEVMFFNNIKSDYIFMNTYLLLFLLYWLKIRFNSYDV